MPNITINHAITYTYVEKGDNKGARDKKSFVEMGEEVQREN